MKLISKKYLMIVTHVIVIYLLTACGNNNGVNSQQVPTVTNNPPPPPLSAIIDAGQNKYIAAGHVVSLQGTIDIEDKDSSDIDIGIVWKQTDGDTKVVIENAHTLNPTFIAPHVEELTLLTFAMNVTYGTFAKDDTVTIRVRPTTVPTILPVDPMLTYSESNVSVHASTLAPSTPAVQTHLWTQISGPAVALEHTEEPQVTFNAAEVGEITSPVTIELSHIQTSTPPPKPNVDTNATSATTLHTVLIVPAVPVSLPIPLSVTISNASSVTEGLTAHLHISATGGLAPYTYTWSQHSGAAITVADLSDPENPSFAAPSVEEEQIIELKVIVRDTNEDNVTKIFPMTIKNALLGVDAGEDITTSSATTVHLSAIPTSTSLLTPMTYQWSEISGNDATILNAQTDNPEIVLPSVTADYEFEIKITDSLSNIATDNITIKATNGAKVNAGVDFTAIEEHNISLHGTHTGAHGTVTISWEQTSGETVTLTNDDSLNPTLKAPILQSTHSEVFTFNLNVTDDKGFTKSDSVEVNISPVLPTVSIVAEPSLAASSTSRASCIAIDGKGPYVYEWSDHPSGILTFTSSVNEPEIDIKVSETASSPVTLTCTATDRHNRKVETTHTVSTYKPVPVLHFTIAAEVSSKITEKEIGHLMASIQNGTAPYTYQWIKDYGSGNIAFDTKAKTDYFPGSVATAGEGQEAIAFHIEAKDAEGEEVSSAQKLMIVKDVPIIATLSGPTTVLRGQILHLHMRIEGGKKFYTYKWYAQNKLLGTTKTPNFSIDTRSAPVNGTTYVLHTEVTNTKGSPKETTRSNDLQVTVTPASLPIKAYNVLDYGLKGDGVTDDSAALEKLAQNTDVINWYFPVGKTFLLSQIVVPTHVKSLYGGGTIRAKAYTDRSGSGQAAIQLFRSYDGLVIDGLAFTQENKPYRGNDSLPNNAWPNTNTSYSGPSGSSWRWWGNIVIGGEATMNDIEIRNCTFDMSNFKFSGIKVVGGSSNDERNRINTNLRIHHNVFTNYGEFALELIALNRHPDSRTLEGCHINDNTFTNGGQAISFIMIRGGNVDGTPNGTESYINNNTITKASWGIELGGTRGVHVHNNYIVDIEKRGFSKSDISDYMPAEGKNFWYNNHMEMDGVLNFGSQFEARGSIDEFYNNYISGPITIRNLESRHHLHNSHKAGNWHDNTLVLDDGEDVYPAVIQLLNITSAIFEDNEIYASSEVSSVFVIGQNGGTENVRFINNKMYMRKSNALGIWEFGVVSPTYQSGNILENGYTGTIPTSRPGAGLLLP